MSVIPIHARGVNKAKLSCDECRQSEEATCSYERRPSGEWEANAGQLRRKLVPAGWAVINGKDLCPACAAKRRAANHTKGSDDMAKSTATPDVPVVEPTAKQMRLIILALEDAYDDTARRYRGGHTDASIARDIGDGIRPGWVADQRERLFGPAGNEEIDALRAQIAALRKETAESLGAMEKRLDALVASHDRRIAG